MRLRPLGRVRHTQATFPSTGADDPFLSFGSSAPNFGRMSRTVAAFVALGLGLALWGTSAWAGSQSVVPSPVRRAIVRDYPGMAYVPGRLPRGYRYASWTHSKKATNYEYQLVFAEGSASKQLDLQVFRRACPAAPAWPAMGTLHVDGHAIKWSRTNTGTTVWRCMKNQGRAFVIFGLNGPRAQLADLVGYANPAH